MKLAKLRIRVPANDLAAWDTQLNEARKDFLSFSRLQQKDRLEDLTGKLQNLKQKQADRKDGERRRPVVPTLPDTPAAPAAAK